MKAPRLPRSLSRALARAERAWSAARAAAIPDSHAGLRLGGWDVDFANVDAETATMTVHKGKQHLKLTVGVIPTVGECPDAEGEVTGRAPFVFDIDGEFRTDKIPEGWPDVAATPASAFVHVTSALHVKATSHDDESAHLVDFDARGKDVEHVQLGLRDAHGKVLATNRPTVATMTLRADHIKPYADGEAWTRRLLGQTRYSATLTNQPDGEKALQGAVLKWLLAVTGLGKAYEKVEAEHWQRDCMQITGSATPVKLRSNAHGQVVVTGVTARGGTLEGPVALTMTANAAVSPASAAWTGTPIPLDYTAPASRDWDGEGVTVRAVGKMGAGSETFRFEHDRGTATLRITSRITRSFGDHGSATFDLRSEVPLQFGGGDGPPTAFGSAPLTWNTFDYHDDGNTEYCQTGAVGVNDYDGVGADPGAIQVTEAFPFDDYAVSFRITPPVEHYVSDTRFDPSGPGACPDVHYAIDHTLWFNGLSALANLPGVKVDDLAAPATWTVGGFQDGTGEVAKFRDLQAGDVRMRVELVEPY